MDVESKETINQAIDRLRDGVVTPLLAELAALRALIERVDGTMIMLKLGAPK